MLGTPHSTKVGHTFPLVTLGFMTCAINLSLKLVPKNVLIIFFFNSLGNTHVTPGERLSGGTSTLPHPRVRVRAQGNAVYPPKTQVYGVRMRPREFKCSHMDETSSSSTNIRALRVRVRVTGL